MSTPNELVTPGQIPTHEEIPQDENTQKSPTKQEKSSSQANGISSEDMEANLSKLKLEQTTTPSASKQDDMRRKLIKKWTSHKELIAVQNQLLMVEPKFPKDVQTLNLMYLEYIPMGDLPSAFPPIELTASNMIDIKTLSSNIGKVMTGKFLLCKTITQATEVYAIETVVEDSRGKRAVRLQLYNYSATLLKVVRFEIIIPCGSFLIVKHPWLRVCREGDLAIRCDDPTQVDLMSPKALEKLFPGITWNGGPIRCPEKYNSLMPQDQKPPPGGSVNNPPLPRSTDKNSLQQIKVSITHNTFWDLQFQDDTAISLVLKRFGDGGFIHKRYTDAIRWYTMSLDYNNDPEFVKDVVCNRSSSYLNLRCFNRALEDTNTVLEIDPNHIKAVYRRTKALLGLQMYSEALNYISKMRDASKELNAHVDLLQLYYYARSLNSPRPIDSYDVDMSELLGITPETEIVDDIPQYTGPVETSQIEGKGRGIIASEDIPTGQLLISSKAFSLVKNLQDDPIKDQEGVEPNSGCTDSSLFFFMGQTAYKIHYEPESGPEFYDLHAGPSLGSLPLDSPLNRSVDMLRISGIIAINCIRGCPSPIPDPAREFLGLHISPSFINHSCSDSNSTWSTHGEVMLIRAIKPIKKGEEVLISYVEPQSSFERRSTIFQAEGFTCNCRLCQLDKNESPETREQRYKHCTKLGSLLLRQSKMNSVGETKAVLRCIDKLESLRVNNPKLNACLAHDFIFTVTKTLINRRQFRLAVTLANKVYAINKEIGNAILTVMHAVAILRCHMGLGNRKEIHSWVETLRQDVIAAYGSHNAFESVDMELISDLEMLGINFVKE